MQTPLHIAARLGTVHIAKIILGFKPDTEIKTKEGDKAIDVARKFNRKDIYGMLNLWDMISRRYIA